MRILILSLVLASFPGLGVAADTPEKPKARPGSIFLTSPLADTPDPPKSWPLTVRQFRWLIIDEALYTGPLTLDGSDNPAVKIFAVKQGVEYPGWKEGETEWKLHTPPASKNEVFFVGGQSQAVVNITAWGIRDSKPVKLGLITLNVGGAPQPKPPVPVPDPIPDPVPTEFDRQLQAAFTADTAAGATVENAKKLAALYRGAAKSTVQDEGLTTAKALFDEISRAVHSKQLNIPHGSFDKTTRVIVDGINASLPQAANTPLDKATRDKISASFEVVAEAMGGLK